MISPDNCRVCGYPLAGGECANCVVVFPTMPIDDPPDDPRNKCKSCGVPFTEHIGVQGTCAELMRLRDALHAVMMVEHTLPDGKTSHVIENRRRRKIAIEALTAKHK